MSFGSYNIFPRVPRVKGGRRQVGLERLTGTNQSHAGLTPPNHSNYSPTIPYNLVLRIPIAHLGTGEIKETKACELIITTAFSISSISISMVLHQHQKPWAHLSYKTWPSRPPGKSRLAGATPGTSPEMCMFPKEGEGPWEASKP